MFPLCCHVCHKLVSLCYMVWISVIDFYCLPNGSRVWEALFLMNGSSANNLETHGSEGVNRPLTTVFTESGSQQPFIFILQSHQMAWGIFFLHQFCLWESTSLLLLEMPFLQFRLWSEWWTVFLTVEEGKINSHLEYFSLCYWSTKVSNNEISQMKMHAFVPDWWRLKPGSHCVDAVLTLYMVVQNCIMTVKPESIQSHPNNWLEKLLLFHDF